jgi:3-hydroxyacyl-CoA dehydrogenase/enoyl-CoA hydratase/3-hydroxybutyryl-CoA epimerase
MPMGPLRLLDEVGVDVAAHVASTLEEALPHLPKAPPLIHTMVAAKLLGRTTGRGFYNHTQGGTQLNKDIPRMCQDWGVEMLPATISERLVLLMVNEAARCLEEHVSSHPDDIDFAMIMGTGWAPFRGGPLRYADAIGPTKIVASLEKYANNGEPEFLPCNLLIEKARTHTHFHEN